MPDAVMPENNIAGFSMRLIRILITRLKLFSMRLQLGQWLLEIARLVIEKERAMAFGPYCKTAAIFGNVIDIAHHCKIERMGIHMQMARLARNIAIGQRTINTAHTTGLGKIALAQHLLGSTPHHRIFCQQLDHPGFSAHLAILPAITALVIMAIH